MDDFAKAAQADADPYQFTLMSPLFQDFASAHEYEVGWLADRALWDISELADAPWGPQSMEICVSTVLEFVQEWIDLPGRHDEAIQREFFAAWIVKAQGKQTAE